MRAAAAILVLLSAPAAAAPDEPSFKRERSFRLEDRLQEVSGLAPAGPHSLFAHNDEFAIIHEVSLEDGGIVRSFAFGKPTLKADIEAIARVGEAVWLAASDGRLFEAQIEAHRKRTPYNVYDTGLTATCEIEGLAAGEQGSFFLLCKRALDGVVGRLRIFEWTFVDRFAGPRLVVDAALADLIPKKEIDGFRPSDLARDPKSGDFLILNASGGVLAITASGGFQRYDDLDGDLHPQPEGLALLPDGRLAVADEGGKRGGALALYRRR